MVKESYQQRKIWSSRGTTFSSGWQAFAYQINLAGWRLDESDVQPVKWPSHHPSAMYPAKDRPVLQVGDFVKAQLEEEEYLVSVKERIGNYAVLSNGVRIHVLDDRWKSKEQWIHEPTGFVIKLATGS